MTGAWNHSDETVFEVTGVLVNGRRFKPIVTKNFLHAKGINLYRGSVWVRESANSPRKLLWEIYN